MGKVTRLFGRRKGGSNPLPRDIASLVAPLANPAVQLLLTDGETPSYFGGHPAADSPIEWPCKSGKPLRFLASLHLESLREVRGIPWLPPDGRLLFFYDDEEQPWGFDPKDQGSWSVVHVADGSESVNSIPSNPPLPRRHIAFRSIRTYPSWERPEIDRLRLSDKESDALTDICSSSYGGAAEHQVGGYPSPIQGDAMELECQLVSHGIYCGDSSGYQDSKAEPIREGAKDWRLLLQVASDDVLDVMWGDMGNLYFWIREQDAQARRFDRAWVILQCS